MKRRRLGADRLIALAWAPNSAAMPADTSSAAGANAPVVGTAAAAFAALMVERMAAKSVAAASNASGLAITNDIAHLHQPAITRLRRNRRCVWQEYRIAIPHPQSGCSPDSSQLSAAPAPALAMAGG